MRKIGFSLLLMCVVAVTLSSAASTPYTMARLQLADRGEVYFRFSMPSAYELQTIGEMVSIDMIEGQKVEAFANEREFESFLRLGLDYEVLTPPDLAYSDPDAINGEIRLAKTAAFDWTRYPTYAGFLDIISQMVALYPAFVDTQTLADTLNNTTRPHRLMALRVTNGVQGVNGKPEFLITAGIHGNEIFPILLSLRLTNWLCANYETDPRAKRILDSIDLCIIPSMNPDGTWKKNDGVIHKANPTRSNYKGVDLNRNYPRLPGKGDDPTPQKETVLFMEWVSRHNFVMEIDFHGGTEGISYPWSTVKRAHVDDAWYNYITRQFADTAQALGHKGFWDNLCNGGGQGSKCLYTSVGTEKDWLTYYRHVRASCFEAGPKLLAESKLESYWSYLRNPLLTYIQQCLNGIRGTVTDSLTGYPLQAKVWVEEHDTTIDSSHVFSDSSRLGAYYRPIDSGTYAVTFTAPGYVSKTVSGIRVEREAANVVDVKLRSVESLYAAGRSLSGDKTLVIAPLRGGISIDGLKKNSTISIFTPSGRLLRSLHSATGGRIVWDGSDLRGMSVRAGCFIMHVASTAGVSVRRVTLLQ